MNIYVIFMILLNLSIVLSYKETIVILGKTGTGKSTLVNNLIGKKIANTNDYDVGTFEIEKYNYTISKDRQLEIFDTPGFFDDLNAPTKYIEQITNLIDVTNLILIVFDLSESRWTRRIFDSGSSQTKQSLVCGRNIQHKP